MDLPRVFLWVLEAGLERFRILTILGKSIALTANRPSLM